MSKGDVTGKGLLGRLRVFEDTRLMVEFLVRKWQEISQDSVERHGFFAVALSGGRTPGDFYHALAEHKEMVLWDRTHIFLVDERFVPDTDSDSNYRMIRDALLYKAPIPAQNVHPISTAGPDPASCAKMYEEDLQRFFELLPSQLPVFDLVMLGMGADGHTASLFPGSPVLDWADRLAGEVSTAAGEHSRITLTLPVINNARNIIFLVTGKEKAEVLRDVIGKRGMKLPASLVKPGSGDLLMLADSGAAMLLPEKDFEEI